VSRRFAGYFFALGSAASFGTLAISGKYAYADGVSVSTLMAYRFGCAALGFAIVVAILFRNAPWSTLITRMQMLKLFLLGATILAPEVTLFFMGLAEPGVTAGLAETIFYIFPAWVIVISVLFFKHRITVTLFVCVLAALSGVALTAGTLSAQSLRGIAYLLAASVLYALYVALSGHWIGNVPPMIATAVMLAGTAMTLIVVALIRAEPGPVSAQGWLAVAMAIVIGTFLAYSLMYAALHRAPASQVAVLATAEPLVAVILGWLLLSETMAGPQIVGSGLILGAVVWLLTAEYRAERLRQAHP
jgi:drug/metabolite transporter (DMT)-like permease